MYLLYVCYVLSPNRYASVEAGPGGVTAVNMIEHFAGRDIGTNVYKRVNLPNVCLNRK